MSAKFESYGMDFVSHYLFPQRFIFNVTNESMLGRHVSSADLVPGDVYELTDPALSLLPCDSILLTGDCIVNESMLTGEFIIHPIA